METSERVQFQPQLQVVAQTTGRESNTLGKLADALAKAQGQMRGALKDRSNPYYSSTYADLASVWEAIRKPLSENGLSVVQRTSCAKDGVTVETMLLHASGEFLRDSCWVPVVPQTKKDGTELRINAQSYGSAITYARRYSLSAIVGVAAEDDDGNAASNTGHEPAPKPASAKQPERRMAIADAPPASEDPRPEPPPAAFADDAREPETNRERPPAVTFRFGKRKGATSHEVQDKELAWYLGAAREAVKDPEKGRFLQSNQRELDLLEAEVNWRSTGQS